MRQESKIFYLKFPLNNAENFEGQVLVLRSCDVVGAGGVRKAQVKKLCQNNRIVLLNQTNYIPQALNPYYQLELLKLLSWVRPSKTDLESLDFQAAQKELFPQIFPRTVQALGHMAFRQQDLYLSQMEVGSWLLQDHWRYFAGFLRQQYPDNNRLLQTAQWEWACAWLETQTLGEGQLEDEFLKIEPSLQVVSLDAEAAGDLGITEGLWALWFSGSEQKLKTYLLGPAEALLLDILQEDRRFRGPQLVQMASLEAGSNLNVSLEEWEKKFLTLRGLGIIKGGHS